MKNITSVKLRDYQQKAKEEILKKFKKTNSIVYQAPTGSGKTLTTLYTIIELAKKEKLKSIAWAVHQKELVRQSALELKNNFSVNQKNSKKRVIYEIPSLELKIEFCTWQSLRELIKRVNYDLLVIDEIHQGSSGEQSRHKSFFTILKKEELKKRLFVSATPWDLDPSLFTGILDSKTKKFNDNNIVYTTPTELIKSGHMNDVMFKFIQTADTIELRNLESNNKDIIKGTNEELAIDIKKKKVSIRDELSKNRLKESIVTTMLQTFFLKEVSETGEIPKTIIYTSAVDSPGDPESSKNIKREFKKLYWSKYRKTPRIERADSRSHQGKGGIHAEDSMEQFKSNKLDVLLVRGMAREGFNVPELEVVIDFAPSYQKKLQVQKMGRVTRKTKTKNPLSRYYIPASVHHYIYEKGKKLEATSEGIKELISDSLDLESIEAVKSSLNFVGGLSQLENNELPEKIQATVESFPIESNEEDMENFEEITKPKKTIIVTEISAGIIINDAVCSDLTKNGVKTFSYSELLKLVPGSPDPQGKKGQLLQMAREGAEKPRPHSQDPAEKSLGKALSQYISESSSTFDPDFKKQITKINPKWFEDTARIKKGQLLQMAREGAEKPRPHSQDPAEKSLGTALSQYISENSSAFDPDFKKQITKINPKWFEDTARIKKDQLLQMAREGAEKPRPHSQDPAEKSLGTALSKYISESSGTFDPDFKKQITKINPKWFEDTARIKKGQLLQMAREGAEKPREHSQDPAEKSLGKALSRYIYENSGTFDPDFKKQITKINPKWFKRIKSST